MVVRHPLGFPRRRTSEAPTCSPTSRAVLPHRCQCIPALRTGSGKRRRTPKPKKKNSTNSTSGWRRQGQTNKRTAASRAAGRAIPPSIPRSPLRPHFGSRAHSAYGSSAPTGAPIPSGSSRRSSSLLLPAIDSVRRAPAARGRSHRPGADVSSYARRAPKGVPRLIMDRSAAASFVVGNAPPHLPCPFGQRWSSESQRSTKCWSRVPSKRQKNEERDDTGIRSSEWIKTTWRRHSSSRSLARPPRRAAESVLSSKRQGGWSPRLERELSEFLSTSAVHRSTSLPGPAPDFPSPCSASGRLRACRFSGSLGAFNHVQESLPTSGRPGSRSRIGWTLSARTVGVCTSRADWVLARAGMARLRSGPASGL